MPDKIKVSKEEIRDNIEHYKRIVGLKSYEYKGNIYIASSVVFNVHDQKYYVYYFEGKADPLGFVREVNDFIYKFRRLSNDY